MSKVELLCPAGSFEAFEAALYNGADAIFLAGTQYGARANAANFTMEELKKAVQLAHLYGVKIHVTVNTLIFEDELDACRSYLQKLYEIGVDAVIVQDLGILNILIHEYRKMEIHASTQMHIHNIDGIRQAAKWHLDRCVVARESDLELIRKMCCEGMEIEVFVQGAYCVSYSGECHMSRNIGFRSANRGECAQSCRLPYQLIYKNHDKEIPVPTQGKYLLSLKDLNALKLIGKLIECGVASFKIEGRMKRPEYVACMCRIYRQAIDAYENKQSFDVNETVQSEMKKIFHRGFTEGYLLKKHGLEIMSSQRPNHQGIRIGYVSGFHHNKMQICLEGELNQHDGIRILNEKEDQGFIVNYMYKNGRLVSHAENETIELERVKVKIGDPVMKTSDTHQLERLLKHPQRKVPVSMKLRMRVNEPMLLTVSDGIHEIKSKSQQCVKPAQKQSLDKERVIAQMRKLGNTPFICENIQADLDETIFMPIAMINECRRKAIEELIEKRMAVQQRNTEKKPYEFVKIKQTHILNVNVSDERQLIAAREYPVHIFIENKELYEKYRHMKNVYRNYPRVTHEGYEEIGLIHDIGGIRKGMKASAYMNITNAYAAAWLFHEGVDCVALSNECDERQMLMLVKGYEKLTGMKGNFEAEVYGRTENMVLENCLIKSQLHLENHCQQCHRHEYYIKDSKNEKYRLLGDDECHLKVYHSKTFNKLQSIKKYQKAGITNFRVIFTFEDEGDVRSILERALNEMNEES